MDAQTSSKDDQATRSFVEKLKSVRRAGAGRPDDEMREALKQAVRAELGGLPEVEAGRMLDRARDVLVGEARQREQRLETLEAEARRLTSQAESLRAERDHLAEECARLKASPPPATGSWSGETLVTMRQGLLQITQDPEANPDSLGLPPSEARLFRLVRELLLFALNFESGVHELIQRIQVMRYGQNSMMMKQQKKIIRDRFVRCLDDKEGSVQALKQALDRNKSFLMALYEAYNSAIPQGSRSLLDQLDPQAILDETKGMLLDRFEKAWRTFSNRHADLSSLPERDLWEQFFDPPFKQKMGEHLDSGTARA